MKKINLLVLSFLLAFLLVSCAESDNPSSSNNNNNNNNNNNTGSSYSPTTKGSWWKYEGNYNHTITCTGDTTIAGKKYGVFTSTITSQISFMRDDNGDIAVINFLGDGNMSEFHVMNANSPVGTKWANDLIMNGVKSRYEFVMMNKDTSMTVRGKQYNNVVKLQFNSYFDLINSGNYMLASVGYYYFARGIGEIKIDLLPNAIEELVDYQIK